MEYEVDGVKTDYIWYTRDGSAMRIEDMTDSHIQKSLNYFKRTNVPSSQERIKALTKELVKRGIDKL
jgi:hypothetical protein